MVQSIPLFSLSTEWRAGGPHWHCKWSRRPTLTVAVHCAYFVSPALALQVEPKAHTQSGEVSTVCGMDINTPAAQRSCCHLLGLAPTTTSLKTPNGAGLR